MFDYVGADLINQHLLDMAAEDERRRLMRYRAAQEAYQGHLPDPLKARPNQVNDNVKVNKCRVIVDAAVTFLFGEKVEFGLTGQAAAEEWLKECWQRNNKMTTLLQAATNGAICGHTFLKIEYPSALTAPYPRLIVLDPANVTVQYDDADFANVFGYRIRWNAVDRQTAKPIVRQQRIERQPNGLWLIIDEVAQPGQYKFTEVGRALWAYTFPPIIGNQNIIAANEYYGESDIPEDVIGLNMSRNFVLSNWQRIVKFQAHQRLWGRGFRDDQVTLGPDDILIIESETGVLDAINPPESGMGRELDDRINEAIHETSRTPAIATGKVDNVGQLSGLALQILYGPLVQKTIAKRQTYGDALIELNRRLLALGGYGDTLRVEITWPEMIPQDMMQERQALQTDAGLGVVSVETMAGKLGYDWRQEQERMAAATGTEDDAAPIATEDEGKRLLVMFQAASEAVNAGIPLETFLKKYLQWSDSEIAAVTAEQEAEAEADAQEREQRMQMMQMQQEGNGANPQEATRPTTDGRGTGGGGRFGRDAG